jgi:hypothetical protein
MDLFFRIFLYGFEINIKFLAFLNLLSKFDKTKFQGHIKFAINAKNFGEKKHILLKWLFYTYIQ